MPRHAVGLVFHFKSAVAWLILHVKLLNSWHSKFAIGAARPAARHKALSGGTGRVQPTPKRRLRVPLQAKLICERSLAALCAPEPLRCQRVPHRQERCARVSPSRSPALPSFAGIQESGATGGSNIWSSSVCQGEGAICQAKQDFVVYRFVRRGRAFLREASSRCYLRCCWLELVRPLGRGSWGDFRSWLPSAFLRSRVAEKCWH